METFFTTSPQVQQIIKGFTLTKTLFVSSIIVGEAHTGKKTLARYLFPQATLVSGGNQAEVELALAENEELIITDFEKLSNQNRLDFSNKRIIATANYISNASHIDDTFAFIYRMPSLNQRMDDTLYLRDKFITEVISTLIMKKEDIQIEDISLDLSSNSKSLKKSIFQHVVKVSLSITDIQDMIYTYLYNHYEGNDNYRLHLGLYEIPLIEAGLKKYGSQLQLAQALGINRNTLRKKIHEHNIK